MGILDHFSKENKLSSILFNHRNLYLLGLATILCGLAWSNALMSIGQFILIGNWIIEFDFNQKINSLKSSPLIWVLLTLFFLHLIGLLWTEDFNYAFKDLRVKLPLLALPLIIGTSKKLNSKEWKILVHIYIITIFVLTLVSLGKYFGVWGEEITNKRQLSIYISHIRYGLNIALAAGLTFYFKPYKKAYINWIITLWLLICLIIFQLYTGLAILLILCLFFGIRTLLIDKLSLTSKSIIAGLSFVIIVSTYFIINNVRQDFYTPIELDYEQEHKGYIYSATGEAYWSDLKDKRNENGVFVRRFIAISELKREWSKRSDLTYAAPGGVEIVLQRFLSSKGLKKDSVGLSKLSDQEINAIEKGVANVYYLNHNSIQNRVHKTFFELEEYKRTGNASGFSLAMRFEYWKTAKSIIQNNIWIGTGTGDIGNAFKNEYIAQNSKLDEIHRRRSHNQYLTVLATFGLLGIFIFLLFLLLPISFFSITNRGIYIFFLGIISLSFLTEDTLETQAGVTLFALFNSLFILGLNNFNRSLLDNDSKSI